MTSYTPTFGGDPVNPANASYGSFDVSGTLQLEWPSGLVNTTSGVAAILDVESAASGNTIKLPRGDMASRGAAIQFNNVGSFDIGVQDYSGNALYTLTAGTARFTYLRNNSTSAGAWRSLVQGSVAVDVDASTLAGNGLRASTGTELQTVEEVTSINSNYDSTNNDHALFFQWGGGSGTFTLPASSTLWNGFYVDCNNDGTGSLTFTTPDGKSIDGSTTLTLLQDESCRFVWTGTKWLTFGRGRSVDFSVTTLSKSLAGSGNVDLVTVEVAAQVQEFTGVLTGDRTVTYGSTPNFYYVFNNTTGAYDVTFRAVSGDPGVVVEQGTRTILVSDGAAMNTAVDQAGGTVTTINTAARLTGGPITTSGTLDLATVTGTPGVYQVLTGTVDQWGRVVNPGESQAALTVSSDRTVSAGDINFSGGRIRGSWINVPCVNPMFIDLSAGMNFSITLTGSPLIIVKATDPTKVEGQGGVLRFIHSTSGWSPTFSSTTTSGFRTPAVVGAMALSAVSGGRDMVAYIVDTASPLTVNVVPNNTFSSY